MTRLNPPGDPVSPELVYRAMIAVTDQVAEAALSGADAEELTCVFSRISRKTVVLLDPALGLRASATSEGNPAAEWNPDDPVIRRVLTALAADRRPIRVPAITGVGTRTRGCVATPVAVGVTLLGFLLVFDEATARPNGDLDLLVAGQAATLFALTMAHERTSVDLGLRFKAAVVDALVSGHYLDAADARRKALSIGIPGNAPFRVGVLRLSPRSVGDADPPAGRALERGLAGGVASNLVSTVPGVVVATRGDDVVAMVPELDGRADREAGPAADVMAVLAEAARAAGLDDCPTAGVSERTAHPDMAPNALRQAEHAIDLGLRLGRSGQVIVYDQLGIYRLLLQLGDTQQLLEFAEGVLGPLIDYDLNHKVQLVRTLSVYLSQHASLKQAARRLRVHANTISYRMQRIEALTPLDLTDPEDRLVAHVAVKIVESLRGGGAVGPSV